MGIIISGFSNIGKSTFAKRGESVIDLDTCYFKKNDGWIDIYIECMLALKDKYDYVFITTYSDVLQELNKRKVEYYLIYPERELKEEYRQRAIQRNSDDSFIQSFFDKWDTHINDCENNTCPNKIILKKGEYLSDVINSINKNSR